MKKIIITSVALMAALAIIISGCGGGSTTTVQNTPTLPPQTTTPAPAPAPAPVQPGPAPQQQVNGWTVPLVQQLIARLEKAGISPGAAQCISVRIIQAFTPGQFAALSDAQAYQIGIHLGKVCGS